MAELTTIARPYAEAAFRTARDENALPAWSEMLRFALDLRSITQGRGSFAKKFDHYEEMPAHLAKGIIEEFQKQHEAAS